MVKGGARQVSAQKAIAKGMGIPVFINVLKEIDRIGNWVSVEQVHKSLKFGGERTETCRSYFKELWRHGLIERKEGCAIIPCTSENWSKGGRPLYRITRKGKEILEVPDKHMTFALAWLLVKADNPSDFEQLHKTFMVLQKRNLPLNYFEASKITGVVRDSIKAIMYGWLEPLGFLDRVNGTFKLDTDYFNWLKSLPSWRNALPPPLSNLIEIKVKENVLVIKTEIDLPPISPELENYVRIPFHIDYRGKEPLKIMIKGKIHQPFMKRFVNGEAEISLILRKSAAIKQEMTFQLKKEGISESFNRTELGFFELKIGEKSVARGALPTIFLTTKSDFHEYIIANLLGTIGFKPIRLSKSDRPDAIIFPERKEGDFEKFLHNDELKILVETTSAEVLTLAKIKTDLENFKHHTSKVLKINAKRTLIIGNKIANNVRTHIPQLKKEYHPFTIIAMRELEYLKEMCVQKNKTGDWSILGKILCYDGIVDKKVIDDVFST